MMRDIAAGEPRTAGRIAAIDRLRGLIMALMALDHTRIFFLGFTPDPVDLDTTTPALFATRWITHLCAPGFLMLAGAAAFLHGRGGSRAGLSAYLASRGALLVLLEVTIVTFAWIPDPGRSLILLQVIWAIGWSMILLAGLVWLPRRAVGLVGLAGMALHPLLGAEQTAALGLPAWMHVVLLEGGQTIETGEGTRVIVSYAILPWAAVMAAGYGLGPLFLRPPREWAPRAAALGAGCLAAFLALRWANLGDPGAWVAQPGPALTVISFLNAEKYPPSPAFLLMTLGPLLLLLAAFGRGRQSGPGGVLAPFGRAPLFFYVVHLYLLRAAGLGMAAIVWGPSQLGPPPLHSAPEWPLWAAWLVWLAALTLLYRPTRWFAGVKARRRSAWTSYF